MKLDLRTNDELTTRLKNLFKALVIGFGPKGRPGKTCDSLR